MVVKLFKKNLRQKNWGREIDPDEIFIDSKNLPEYDQSQFEGRLEKPLSKATIISCGVLFVLIILVFVGKIAVLEIKQGGDFAEKSSANSLRQTSIFAERGMIYDRNKTLLVSNKYNSVDTEFPRRVYAPVKGLAPIVGYLRYPAKDSHGFYYQSYYEGMDGAEKIYNDELVGKNGLKIVETNALGSVISESTLQSPQDGASLTLSIDSRIQEKLYNSISATAKDVGFSGGAGVLMDIHTGEILALASYPEYDSNIMSDKTNQLAIKAFLSSADNPFLNRVTDGLYTPGSIVKPFIALAALKERVIDPKTKILSTGSISIPNPFDPKKQSVFKDWRAQGLVDMREALAVSSDVYFYEIGGGFEDQRGLGIGNIEKYMRLFGFGQDVPDNPLLDMEGTIPSPAWKAENFKGDQWRIGDTYNTSIGQYGFQVTPLQMARGISSIANDGLLLNPTLIKSSASETIKNFQSLPFSADEMTVVKEGMRQAALSGTAKGLNIPEVAIAAKTGTAELGVSKKFVNSWVVGFFPYEKPRYAFVVLMEKGPYENTIGGLFVMRKLFEWMGVNAPEYLK